ncbi:MAG: hypothetical protein RJB60_2372 [Pseudomonadota bacterium]|jgi:hypothetical protein
MIPVSPRVLKPEPANFDAQCRQKGRAWLLKNPKGVRKAKRPKDFWSPFRPDLADAFANLCAYGAMHEPNGTVDHFRPVNANEALAYEWQNYRYVTGWINSSKSKRPKVLDAFQVKAGWFEVLLPSLQLVAVKAKIPVKLHALVDDTLRDLHLCDDERVLRQRREWLRLYEEGKLNFEGLSEMAPLIAAAVAKRDELP